MTKLFFTFFFLLFFSYANAGTRHPSIDDEQTLSYGQHFIHTVLIIGINNEGDLFGGSGVAINDRVILTAAHLLWNSKKVAIYIPHKKEKYAATEAIIHGDFDFKKLGYNDIALLVTDKKMNYEWYPKLYSPKNELGKLCSMSGYGASGTFKTGAITKDDQLRAGSNIISKIEKNLLICTASKELETSLEYITNSGDSGGPLFIDNKIAGINSAVLAYDRKVDGNFGDESGHTRVSLFTDWITENAQRHLDK